jgi:flavin reductase (DIM6/NTAB) family NADH-FMN oxidoreductase RutF
MTMRELNYYDISERLTWALRNGGAFLTVKDGDAVNTMTIGWGATGNVWGKPTFMAMVRFSRHTHPMMDNAMCYTVSIPRKGELQDALRLCGTKSGRDMDKFAASGITSASAKAVDGAIVAECDLHIECRVLYVTDMNNERMDGSIAPSYQDGDFHTLYFGEILACYSTDE